MRNEVDIESVSEDIRAVTGSGSLDSDSILKENNLCVTLSRAAAGGSALMLDLVLSSPEVSEVFESGDSRINHSDLASRGDLVEEGNSDIASDDSVRGVVALEDLSGSSEVFRGVGVPGKVPVESLDTSAFPGDLSLEVKVFTGVLLNHGDVDGVSGSWAAAFGAVADLIENVLTGP